MAALDEGSVAALDAEGAGSEGEGSAVGAESPADPSAGRSTMASSSRRRPCRPAERRRDTSKRQPRHVTKRPTASLRQPRHFTGSSRVLQHLRHFSGRQNEAHVSIGFGQARRGHLFLRELQRLLEAAAGHEVAQGAGPAPQVGVHLVPLAIDRARAREALQLQHILSRVALAGGDHHVGHPQLVLPQRAPAGRPNSRPLRQQGHHGTEPNAFDHARLQNPPVDADATAASLVILRGIFCSIAVCRHSPQPKSRCRDTYAAGTRCTGGMGGGHLYSASTSVDSMRWCSPSSAVGRRSPLVPALLSPSGLASSASLVCLMSARASPSPPTCAGHPAGRRVRVMEAHQTLSSLIRTPLLGTILMVALLIGIVLMGTTLMLESLSALWRAVYQKQTGCNSRIAGCMSKDRKTLILKAAGIEGIRGLICCGLADSCVLHIDEVPATDF